MNLANEMDIELDEAVKQHLRLLFSRYFASSETQRLSALQAGMKQLEIDIVAAEKALADL